MASVTSRHLSDVQADQDEAVAALERGLVEPLPPGRWQRVLLRLRPPARAAGAARAATSVAASLGAAGCTVAGVHDLAGTGWALLSAVPFLLLLERRLT